MLTLLVDDEQHEEDEAEQDSHGAEYARTCRPHSAPGGGSDAAARPIDEAPPNSRREEVSQMRREQMKTLIEQGRMTNAPFRLKRISDRTRLRSS